MQTPLNASASTAGALLSSSTFEVPQFQREYSWQLDEVSEFFDDLQGSLDTDSYFMGLIILTAEDDSKHVVDGQQRLITLSLLANALYYEAISNGRNALADRIKADFLRSIDYDSDRTNPRVRLADKADNDTFQTILDTGKVPTTEIDRESVSFRLSQSYRQIIARLREDLRADPFKRLGKWTEFLTNRLYFAVFVHPEPSSAYQVFEVINTRGRELTTADLLKNYVLSQTNQDLREARYAQWQGISRQFSIDGANNFVQYIRHAVTVDSGHILPKDLFGFLARRFVQSGRIPPTSEQLMAVLEAHLPLYRQMIDQTIGGPASEEELKIFSALNSLNVISVRPILLALASTPDSLEGMKHVLRLVVRRIVAGNLGTGNVERKFGEAARKVTENGTWKVLIDDLSDLNPTRDAFLDRLRTRSFNKAVLSFLRRSIVEKTITPELDGTLHFIWTGPSGDWPEMSQEDGAFWGSTIGNTFLSSLERRPEIASNWAGFKTGVLPTGVPGEWTGELAEIADWNAGSVDSVGTALAERASEIWY